MPQNLGANHPQQTPATTSTLSSSAGPVNILFPFIKEADVLVFLGGTLKTNGTGTDNYTINAAKTQVTFNNAVSGDVIITRKSDLLNKVHTFTPGSSVRSADLNTQFDQVMQLIQDNYELLRGIILNDGNDEITVGRDSIIANDKVRTESIQDNAVTLSKIAAGNANQVLITSSGEPTWSNDVDVQGTLDVTSTTTLDGALNVAGNTDLNGTLDVDGNTELDDVNVSGTLDVAGNSTFDGDVDLGNSAADTITITGEVDSNIVPSTDGSRDLGSSTKRWNEVHADNIQATTLSDGARITASEQVAHTPDDTTYYTTSAADQRFWRQDAAGNEVIQTSATWTANDSRVATTGAIDARIVNLVTEVGGFVPIANETSFPATNPDINDGAGTIVSIGALASDLTFNGSGQATITDGAGSGNNVTITGGPASTTIASNSGALVETTTTLHTYTWHRTTPDGTNVNTVANAIANVNTVANNIADVNTVAANNADIDTLAAIDADITTLAHIEDGTDATDAIQTVAGISANVTTVAGISADVTTVAGRDAEIQRLGTADAVADMNTLATTAIVGDMDTLADIATDITTLAHVEDGTDATDAIQTVAGSIANVNTVANDLNETTSEIDTVATNISNVNAVGNDITNVNTVAGNLAGVNAFAARYRAPQTTANEYSTDNDTGDLYFNTSSNELRVFNGTSWQAGVTAGTGFASLTGATFTGPILLDNNDDEDVPDLSFDGDADTGIWSDAADHISFTAGGTKVFEIGANGVEVGAWNGTTIDEGAGGTGETTYSNGQLLIGNNSNGLTKATLTGTAPVTITNGDGSITIDVSDASTSADGLMSSGDKTKLDGIATGAEVNVATNLSVTTSATTNVIASSTGDNATLNEATSSAAGLMSTTHHDKLDGIATGAEVNVATNLGQTTAANQLTITSSTGDNIVVAEATSSIAGLMSTTHHDKLDGIATGAEVNVATNLAVTLGTSSNVITSSTGTNATISEATSSAAGLMSTFHHDKLDGIEGNADVTDATNVAAAGAVMESDTTTASMSFVIDEDDMASDSSTRIPTQQSVKAYVDNSAPALTVTTLPVHGDGQVGGAISVSTTPSVTGGIPPYSIATHQWQIQGSGGTNWVNVGTGTSLTVPETVNDGGTTRDTDGGKIRVQVTMQDSTPGTALTSGTVTSEEKGISAYMFALRFPTNGCIAQTSNSSTWTIVSVNSGADTNNVRNVANVAGAGDGNTGWMLAILENGEVWRNTDRTWTSALNTQETQYDSTGKTIAGIVSSISDNSEQVVYTDGSVRDASGTLYDASVSGNSPCVNYGGQGNHGTPMFILEDGTWMWCGLGTASFQGQTYTTRTPVDIMPGSVKLVRCAAFRNGNSVGSGWDGGHGTAAWILLGDDGFLYTAEVGSGQFPSDITDHGTMAAGGAKRLEFNGTTVTNKFLDVGAYSSVGATWSSGYGFSALRDNGEMWVYSNGTWGTTFQRYGTRSDYTTAFHNGGHSHKCGLTGNINSGVAYTTTAGQMAAFDDGQPANNPEADVFTPTNVTNRAVAASIPIRGNISGVGSVTNQAVHWFIPRS